MWQHTRNTASEGSASKTRCPRPWLAHGRQSPRWLRWSRVCLQWGRSGFNPWVGKIPWGRKWQPTPAFLPGKSHGWKCLAGYGPWGHNESDMTESLYFVGRITALTADLSFQLLQRSSWYCVAQGPPIKTILSGRIFQGLRCYLLLKSLSFLSRRVWTMQVSRIKQLLCIPQFSKFIPLLFAISFFIFKNYFWPGRVLVAVCRLSLVAVSRSYFSLGCVGFS